MGLVGSDVEKMERNRDVAGLIKALDNKDTDIENKAQMALVRIGELAVEPLTNALKDENRITRLSAAEVLGKIGDMKALKPLIEALIDEDSGVRKHVISALGMMGDARAVEPLVQTMRDKDSGVRWEVAETLDELGWKPRNDVEKANYLIAKVSWGELVILGEPSIEPLMQALKDDDKHVREAAEEALEKIKANTLANIRMTKKLVYVIIFTAEPFEENEANILGSAALAFPELVKDVDISGGFITLHKTEIGCSLVKPNTFGDQKTRDDFILWMKNVKEGVYDLPRECEAAVKLLASPRNRWGAIFFHVWLKFKNPQFANSTAFIRKWSVIAEKFLVIGVYSVVPQEVSAASYTVPAPPQPEVTKPSEATLAKKYCVYCEAEMSAEAVYCPKCGKKSG